MNRPMAWALSLALLCAGALPLAAAEKPDAAWYEKSPLGAGILADLIREGDISPG